MTWHTVRFSMWHMPFLVMFIPHVFTGFSQKVINLLLTPVALILDPDANSYAHGIPLYSVNWNWEIPSSFQLQTAQRLKAVPLPLRWICHSWCKAYRSPFGSFISFNQSVCHLETLWTYSVWGLQTSVLELWSEKVPGGHSSHETSVSEVPE